MGARRYGISLRAFNSTAHEWAQRMNEMSSWTREEKFHIYKQATMCYFVYHRNTIALYWEEKPTSFMNEYKWMDNPRITNVECVGANSQDEKMRWITTTKTTIVVIFNLQNSHLLILSLPTEEVFRLKSLPSKRPKSARGKSSSCRFSFSTERNANTKATE